VSGTRSFRPPTSDSCPLPEEDWARSVSGGKAADSWFGKRTGRPRLPNPDRPRASRRLIEWLCASARKLAPTPSSSSSSRTKSWCWLASTIARGPETGATRDDAGARRKITIGARPERLKGPRTAPGSALTPG